MNLLALQQGFTRHIRDPAAHPAPEGIEARRMKIYNDLIYNNMEGFLASGFPVLKSLLGSGEWHALVRGFVARHRCQTPLFLEIGEEFLSFIRDDSEARALLPPFAEELAHYEWVELALDVDEQEIDGAGLDPDGDLLRGVPALSPLAVPLIYRFPVHRISAAFRPTEAAAQPCCLVVYRDAGDKVRFLEINTVTYRLLELMREGEATGAELADRVGAEIGGGDQAAIRAATREALCGLRDRGVVLGTKHPG